MSKKETRNGRSALSMFEVSGLNEDGELLAKSSDDGAPCGKKNVRVLATSRIKPALTAGDQFIGRLLSGGQDGWAVKPTARTASADSQPEKLYGILEERDGFFYLHSSEKNARQSYRVDDVAGAKSGDFVSITLAGDRKFKQAHIMKNFGPFDLNKATATLILDKYDIPFQFSDKIAKELQVCKEYDSQLRLDLTMVPLVTIDGEDSKDFDDAIWAERSEHGFHLMVAIADVAFYVLPGTELDREAYKRGNSVYLPNMVIPMLPEKLCNGLCSLNPKEKRASIVALIEIDGEGNLLSYEFKRAVIRSAARLTYREVQEALDGKKSANIAPVFKSVIEPVFEAYQALDRAKKKRGALELVTDEIKIKIGKDGLIQSVSKAEHYNSMQIVEEFMIAANVSAAMALKESHLPVMYRIHDKPVADKMTDIEPLLHDMKMKLPEFAALRPEHFNKLIQKCENNGLKSGVSMMVLRLQSTAQYSPNNIGHFGLGLTDYAHFTSPIRRYADLLIHRALIKSLGLPDGGALEDNATLQSFEDIGKHLCETERRAVNAERDITARFISAYLEPSIGQDFEVKVTGISQAGMFVQIVSLGAEGLVPMSSMPSDYYDLPNGNLEIRGQHSGIHFCLGDGLMVKLMEASPITGGLIFKYLDPKTGDDYVVKGGRGFRRAPVARAKPEDKTSNKKAHRVPKTNKCKARNKARKEKAACNSAG